MFGMYAPHLEWNMNSFLHPDDDEHIFWDSRIAIGMHRPGGLERNPRNRPICSALGPDRDMRMLQQDAVVCLPCLIPVGKNPDMGTKWGKDGQYWYVPGNAYFCLICKEGEAYHVTTHKGSHLDGKKHKDNKKKWDRDPQAYCSNRFGSPDGIHAYNPIHHLFQSFGQ